MGASPSLWFRWSVVYDMHRDHPHCPLPAPAFCSSTTPNATRSGTTKPLPGCLTRLVLTTSPPTLYHATDVPRGILTPALPASACRAPPINAHHWRRAHATIPPQRPVQRLPPCCDHSCGFRLQA
ncbi:hypothetical protein DFH08DRAFT_1090511 [Mycena albidolilacea]|uniref:Uncharacterized protein n=1 Tax=Mycena albidolilacea TaxID=1033008 RepID=A0AAD6YWR6_9AGAR|nr:hypothetical protein DFH08DRAFT_1090511 [Mycena albidolilacea]